MRINYTFRNLDSSEGMKAYATEKVARLQKFLRTPLHAEVTFSTERHLHCLDVSVTADGHRFAAREEQEDMYASIDLALDKLDRQVRERKAAATHKKRNSNPELLSGKNG